MGGPLILTNLPSEVRQNIYHRLFAGRIFRRGIPGESFDADPHMPTAIMFACKQCFTEARQMLLRHSIILAGPVFNNLPKEGHLAL